MKITSDELGKLLVAFGRSLMESNEGSNDSLPPLEEPAQVVTGSFDTEAPVIEQEGATKARIAELSSELATLQNQSGLDLKPIKM